MKKYYINGVNIISLCEKIKPYKSLYETQILTEQGIIKIIKDSYVLFTLKLNDLNNEIIYDLTDNKNIYVDHSNFVKNKIIHNIPILHKKINVKKNIYKIKGNNIQLETVFINNKLKDYYFICNKNIADDFIHRDIIRFINY